MYIYSPKLPSIGSKILITGTKTKFDNGLFKVIGLGNYGRAFAIDTGDIVASETYGININGKWHDTQYTFILNEYVMGSYGHSLCPLGSEHVTSIEECASAPLLQSMNSTFGKAGCYPTNSRGCIKSWGKIHFNICNYGITKSNIALICKREIIKQDSKKG